MSGTTEDLACRQFCARARKKCTGILFSPLKGSRSSRGRGGAAGEPGSDRDRSSEKSPSRRDRSSRSPDRNRGGSGLPGGGSGAAAATSNRPSLTTGGARGSIVGVGNTSRNWITKKHWQAAAHAAVEQEREKAAEAASRPRASVLSDGGGTEGELGGGGGAKTTQQQSSGADGGTPNTTSAENAEQGGKPGKGGKPEKTTTSPRGEKGAEKEKGGAKAATAVTGGAARSGAEKSGVAASASGAGPAPRLSTSSRKSQVGAKGNKGNKGFASLINSLTREIQKKKEACDSIRFLVFGRLGNESMKANEKHLMYESRQGTRQEIFKLHQVWSQMDEDGSGDIELQEFMNFFSRKKADRLLGMRCVKFLVGDKEGASCTVQDMMKLIWLKATPSDIAAMLEVFREAAFHQKRIPTPALLPRRKKKELVENFRWLDKEKKGVISYSDLVDSGLVDEQTANELMAKYDTDQSGDLDEDEFMEMLCPNGYRAHSKVTQAVDEHGRGLTFLKNEYFCGWTLEGALDLEEDQQQGPSGDATDIPWD